MSSKKRSSASHASQEIITLGLTGGIGSGKSYVARLLSQRGIPIYDCDSRAKELYDEDLALQLGMTLLFGPEIYDSETGLLDRKRLAQIIFSDKAMLEQVNDLVHPAIRHDFDEWRALQAKAGARVCIIESAILLQASLVDYVDSVVVVSANEKLRLQRACQRDQVSEAAVQERMRHQLPQDELLAAADFVITNEPEYPLDEQLERLLAALPQA